MFNSKNWLANALMSNPFTRLDDANLSLLDAKHNKKKKKRDTEKKKHFGILPPKYASKSHKWEYTVDTVLYNFFKMQKKKLSV